MTTQNSRNRYTKHYFEYDTISWSFWNDIKSIRNVASSHFIRYKLTFVFSTVVANGILFGVNSIDHIFLPVSSNDVLKNRNQVIYFVLASKRTIANIVLRFSVHKKITKWRTFREESAKVNIEHFFSFIIFIYIFHLGVCFKG